MPDYIIYGLCPAGEAALHECRKRGWNVSCICEDSDIRRKHYDGPLPIYSLKELRENNIIGTFVIAIGNCGQIINKLNDEEKYILLCEILDKSEDGVDYRTKLPHMARRDVDACIAEHSAYLHPEKMILKDVDLEITERCSMRCKDCSNLMQYYEKPKNYDPDDLIKWVKALLTVYDEIFELRLIGGEPFMYPDMEKVLSALIDIDRIRVITFYTNGTIVPSDKLLDMMTTPKVGFCITDYGKLSKNLDRLIEKLDEKKIIYDVHDSGLWTRCSIIKKMDRTQAELKNLFEDCCAKNLYTILNGRLYRCPFMANAMNLNAIPDIVEDYVDILSLEGKKDSRDEVSRFMDKTCWPSCDYCQGRLFDAGEIEPAIQASAPVPYEKHYPKA